MIRVTVLLSAVLSMSPLTAPAESPDSVEGIPSGGRWVAALVPRGESHQVLVQDKETGNLYQLFGASAGVIAAEWASESDLELRFSNGYTSVRVLPPEQAGNDPRFLMTLDVFVPENERGEHLLESDQPHPFDFAEAMGFSPGMQKAGFPILTTEAGMKAFSQQAGRSQRAGDRRSAVGSVTGQGR